MELVIGLGSWVPQDKILIYLQLCSINYPFVSFCESFCESFHASDSAVDRFIYLWTEIFLSLSLIEFLSTGM